jgi:hypothetical protein
MFPGPARSDPLDLSLADSRAATYITPQGRRPPFRRALPKLLRERGPRLSRVRKSCLELTPCSRGWRGSAGSRPRCAHPLHPPYHCARAYLSHFLPSHRLPRGLSSGSALSLSLSLSLCSQTRDYLIAFIIDFSLCLAMPIQDYPTIAPTRISFCLSIRLR